MAYFMFVGGLVLHILCCTCVELDDKATVVGFLLFLIDLLGT